MKEILAITQASYEKNVLASGPLSDASSVVSSLFLQTHI